MLLELVALPSHFFDTRFCLPRCKSFIGILPFILVGFDVE
jgi:hypothetical protein